MESLGDEPYAGQIRRSTSTKSKTGATAPSNHPLMRLFDADGEPGQPGSAGGASSSSQAAGNGWGSGTDTIRPQSINIPDLEEDSGISVFAPSATPWFMASSTAVGGIPLEDELVESDEEDRESRTPSSGRTSFEQPMISAEESGGDTTLDAGGICIPDDLKSPSTLRPGYPPASGNQLGNGGFPGGGFKFGGGSSSSAAPAVPHAATDSGFSGGMGWYAFGSSANPFSKARNRQASNDSVGPFGGIAASNSGSFGSSNLGGHFSGSSSSGGGSSLGTLPPSPPSHSPIDSREGPFGRAASPESFLPRERVGNAAGVSQSPSLPSLSRQNGERQGSGESGETAFSGGRTIVSPRSAMSIAASRLRSNTAPNFHQQQARNLSTGSSDSEGLPMPPVPAAASGAGQMVEEDKKPVLNFGSGKSPFAQARAAAGLGMPRRPSALNLPEANPRLGGGALTPRHLSRVSSFGTLCSRPRAA